MRKLIAIAAVLVALAVLAPTVAGGSGSAGGSGDEARAARRTVTVGNNFFRPTRIRVRRRELVVFDWVGGGEQHQVSGRGFQSRTTASGSYRYLRRFRRCGRFTVICTIHPTEMRMTVRVR